jgi:hypothetical protein
MKKSINFRFGIWDLGFEIEGEILNLKSQTPYNIYFVQLE